MEKEFLEQYFERYRRALFETNVDAELIAMRDLVRERAGDHGKVIFVGNGGSAAIASHAALDFTKQGGVRAVTLNEATLITCFANDYGYESWVARALERWAHPSDLLVLVSSSGRSANIVNGGLYAKGTGLPIVTFTGFSEDNPVHQLGDIRFWLNSRAYNVIECVHQIWLLTVCDLLIGKAEYPVA